jgi:homoserine kinase
MENIKVLTPCSSANLGSGFDVFGLALKLFSDTLTVELVEEGITVEVTGLEAGEIPSNLDRNTAGLVAKKLLLGRKVGAKIRITKGIPIGKGLGSSGASAAACVFALNNILDLGLSKNEQVTIAAMGEFASAGAIHADNVAASLLGGFVIVQYLSPSFKTIRLDPPLNLEVALALPLIETPDNKTAVAREILPKHVSFKDAISNAGNSALLVAGLHLGDVEMIGQGMNDLIVEPFRKKLIPGYDNIKKAALSAGASGVAISGAGPSIIAVLDSTLISADNVAAAMKESFQDLDIACEVFCSSPSFKGTINISD